MMHYALGYAWKLPEIYQNFKSRNLKIDGYSLNYLYGDNHKKALCYKVFKCCLWLILNDVIDNDVEFALPVNSRATSIIMRTYRDKDFMYSRQNGKFADVDFLESDFTGHELQFCMYGGRGIPKRKRIFVDKTLKKKITDYTNQGRVYYGKTKKTLKDYYDQVKKEFPIIPIEDIKKILNFGWKSVYLVVSYGGDVLIKEDNNWFYIGTLRKNSLQHFKYYKVKLCNKMRVMFKRHKCQWDGYYYFTLNDERYQKYLNCKNKRGRPKKWFEFGNILLYKLKEECLIAESEGKHLFRLKYPIDIGFTFYTLNLKTKDAEFVLSREPLKFKDILISNNDYELI